jgi:hypothetical protein
VQRRVEASGARYVAALRCTGHGVMMQRTIDRTGMAGENPAVDAFLAEVWAVCEKHSLGLSHEVVLSAFRVISLTAEVRKPLHDWLMSAVDATD